jgi:hypothetical protein
MFTTIINLHVIQFFVKFFYLLSYLGIKFKRSNNVVEYVVFKIRL